MPVVHQDAIEAISKRGEVGSGDVNGAVHIVHSTFCAQPEGSAKPRWRGVNHLAGKLVRDGGLALPTVSNQHPAVFMGMPQPSPKLHQFVAATDKVLYDGLGGRH